MDARCSVCGKRPAQVVRVERNVGMILMHVYYKNDGPFCRDHARSSARKYLVLTLLFGWWGIRSFFVNFKAVGTDVRALHLARAIPEHSPEPSSEPSPEPSLA
jgi:hypothetical protein